MANERMIEITEDLRDMLAEIINYMEELEEKIGEDDKVWKLVNEAWDIVTDEWEAAGGLEQSEEEYWEIPD